MFRRKEKEAQQAFWIATSELVPSVVNPFYEALDKVLAEAGFHEHVRAAWRPDYEEQGATSTPRGRENVLKRHLIPHSGLLYQPLAAHAEALRSARRSRPWRSGMPLRRSFWHSSRL